MNTGGGVRNAGFAVAVAAAATGPGDNCRAGIGCNATGAHQVHHEQSRKKMCSAKVARGKEREHEQCSSGPDGNTELLAIFKLLQGSGVSTPSSVNEHVLEPEPPRWYDHPSERKDVEAAGVMGHPCVICKERGYTQKYAGGESRYRYDWRYTTCRGSP